MTDSADRKACLPAEGLAFLARLARNNTTAWFHSHKDEYSALVRVPMLAVVNAINQGLSKFAPAYVAAKKDPLGRPNRDIRFSKDKSPYRTDVSVVFPRQGREKHEAAGFFLRVAPDGVELIAGTYMPGPDELRKLRKYLGTHHAAFNRLVNSRPLGNTFGPLLGESLGRVPAPFAAVQPGADLLRKKQFFVRRTLPPAGATTPGFAGEVIDAFRVATPFVEAIDDAL
ncbi:MAG: DUF2461 domain-containing protein [Longimicrobiales bacterium]